MKVVYFKSIVAGILAILLAVTILPILVMSIFLFFDRAIMHKKADTIMFSWHLPHLLSWEAALLILIFSAGFAWEFRRHSN